MNHSTSQTATYFFNSLLGNWAPCNKAGVAFHLAFALFYGGGIIVVLISGPQALRGHSTLRVSLVPKRADFPNRWEPPGLVSGGDFWAVLQSYIAAL